MSSMYADCPDCGYECKFEDGPGIQTVECPRCKKSFSMETGGSYGVAGASPASPIAPDQAVPDTAEFEPEETEGPGGKSWLEAWPQE